MNDITLPQIHVVIMPPDELGRRPLLNVFKQHQQLPAVEWIVLTAIAEVLFDSLAYFHIKILRNSEISSIKERMYILS